ncbi:MAG: hypothetical protein MUO40_05215 [Anaerolineaceae bacterium]|nr:hypothetical protein [Anaerolineaceae bacterium]
MPLSENGLLWFDNDPKMDLLAKVERAAQYFQKKYKVEANYCIVNPCMIHEEKIDPGVIDIQVNPKILPFHFWLGIKDINSD